MGVGPGFLVCHSYTKVFACTQDGVRENAIL